MNSNVPAQRQGPSRLARDEQVSSPLQPAFQNPYETPRIDDEKVPWGRYFSALWRYKWLMAMVVAAGVGVGFYISSMVRPQYKAVGQLFITDAQARGAEVSPVKAEGTMTSTGWTVLPKSAAILDPVVDSLALYLWPNSPADSLAFRGFRIGPTPVAGKYELAVDSAGRGYVLRNSDGMVLDSGALGDSVGLDLGMLWAPTGLEPAQTFGFTLMSPRDATEALKAALVVDHVDGSPLVDLSIEGTDPKRIVETLNAILNQVVASAAEITSRSHTQVRQRLGTQLDVARGQYADASTRLQQFQDSILTMPTEAIPLAGGVERTTGPAVLNYAQMRAQLTDMRQDLRSLERIRQEVIDSVLAPTAFHTVPAVNTAGSDLFAALNEYTLKLTQLQALRGRLQDDNPQVMRAQEELMLLRTNRVMPAADEFIAQMKGTADQLAAKVENAESELKGIPERQITEQTLLFQRENAAAVLADLSEAFTRAQMAEAGAVPDVNVFSLAQATTAPVSAPAPRVFAMVLLVAVALAVLLALMLDRFDKRLRYPDQATFDLGLTVLGAIPSIRRIKHLNQNPAAAAAVVEAFRTIRLALSQAFGQGEPITVAITSPGIGEGKSLVACNLAVALAEGGYQTLLIDGDTRRGELHSTFNVQRRPGLLDYLAGRATVAQAVSRTQQDNLWLLPSGTRFKRGPELLMTPNLQPLLEELKSRFDAVVIDTPPLGAGVDAFALGGAAGNMIVVLRAARSDRKLAEAKLDLVDRLPIRIIGAVLNDFRGTSGFEYYSYLDGYAAQEEEEEDEIPTLASPGSLTTRRG